MVLCLIVVVVVVLKMFVFFVLLRKIMYQGVSQVTAQVRSKVSQSSDCSGKVKEQ